MKARTLITSLIAGSLVLGSSTLVYASQKSDCDRQQRMEQRMEKRLERMTQELDLTPKQQAEVSKLWQEHRPEYKQRRQQGLQALNPNADDYARQVEQQIRTAQQQLAQRMKARADQKAALYAILTPEQEQKFEQLREQRGQRHERRHRGHAGEW